MRVLIYLAVVFTCATNCAHAQFEGCETLTLPHHQDMNLQKFLGSWYVLKVGTKLASQVTPMDVTCHESIISQSEQENVLDFHDNYNLIENGTVTGPASADYDVVLGEVDPENPIPSLWSIHMPGSSEAIGQSVIIASDEDTWALEYVCFPRPGGPVGKLSFWGRHRYLEPLVEKTLNDVARSLGFPLENFLSIEHSQC